MNDFFRIENCDRCYQSLGNTRTTSWFTEETLCMKCADKEKAIRKTLKNSRDFEGCGYIPEIKV